MKTDPTDGFNHGPGDSVLRGFLFGVNDMRNPSLVWYEYPWPHGSGFSASDLYDAELVAQVFAHAETGAARITAEGWKFLWTNYGLDGLTAVVRRSETFG